jgi:hypothetical protein
MAVQSATIAPARTRTYSPRTDLATNRSVEGVDSSHDAATAEAKALSSASHRVGSCRVADLDQCVEGGATCHRSAHVQCVDESRSGCRITNLSEGTTDFASHPKRLRLKLGQQKFESRLPVNTCRANRRPPQTGGVAQAIRATPTFNEAKHCRQRPRIANIDQSLLRPVTHVRGVILFGRLDQRRDRRPVSAFPERLTRFEPDCLVRVSQGPDLPVLCSTGIELPIAGHLRFSC